MRCTGFLLTMAQRAMCLLRRSIGFTAPPAQRALSTTATPAVEGAAVAEATTKEAKKRKKKNLFDVVQFLPGWGVGYKVAKTTWRDVSYQITKINLYKVIQSPSPPPARFHCFLFVFPSNRFVVIFAMQDGRHGKAWGFRYKAG
jgi:hypothetical protein